MNTRDEVLSEFKRWRNHERVWDCQEMYYNPSEMADEIARLRDECDRLWTDRLTHQEQAATAREERTRLELELDAERMRLAACGVAALMNTPDTAAQRIGRDNPYWSASYGDVCAAVDREMLLREKLKALREFNKEVLREFAREII